MVTAPLDTAVRTGAITVVLLLAWLLHRRRRELGMPARLFPPLAMCLSGFLLGNTPGPDATRYVTGALGTVGHYASGFTVVFLWWFCLSCFDPRFRPRGTVLAVGIAWLGLASADRGLLGPRLADRGLSWLLVAMGYGIVGHLVWRLVRDRAGDLLQSRHDVRVWVALILGGLLFVDLSADVLNGFAWRPLAFTLAQNTTILGFGLWLAARLLVVRGDALTGPPPSTVLAPLPGPPLPIARAVPPATPPLLGRLRELIEGERLYLDPTLTLATLAKKMQAPEREVRRLIHQDLGFDHFRAFLNHYRLGEARRRLADPCHAGDKLLAVALDSGFASIASFNRLFREAENRTPSQYRAAALAGVEAPVVSS